MLLGELKPAFQALELELWHSNSQQGFQDIVTKKNVKSYKQYVYSAWGHQPDSQTLWSRLLKGTELGWKWPCLEELVHGDMPSYLLLCVPEDQLPQVTLAKVSFLYIRKSEDRGGWEELLILILDWEGIKYDPLQQFSVLGSTTRAIAFVMMMSIPLWRSRLGSG